MRPETLEQERPSYEPDPQSGVVRVGKLCRACGWELAVDGSCPRCNWEVDVALWHLAQVPERGA